MSLFKKERQRFWMVLVDSTNSTSHRHYSENEAYREAERLAAMGGEDVFVLEASEFVRAVKTEWKKTVT